jgi:two-component system response regulator (stage 0 sporulation protein A)
MPENLKGRKHLAYLLDLVVPSPYLLDKLTLTLYPAAAQRFSTTPAAVERCIRHAIEATWSRGDMAALERLFGLTIDPDRGKPTNREFLAMSAQHMRQKNIFQNTNKKT